MPYVLQCNLTGIYFPYNEYGKKDRRQIDSAKIYPTLAGAKMGRRAAQSLNDWCSRYYKYDTVTYAFDFGANRLRHTASFDYLNNHRHKWMVVDYNSGLTIC